MGLVFQPLAWIYHDGWKFQETNSKNDGKSQKPVDASAKFYHMGHCHLFIPGFDINKESSSLAYSGIQQYKFNMIEQWGPNSGNANANQSLILKGKPIWYFYVEQYWRRMYIQPWDQIDNSCNLPLNQSFEYEKYNYVQYLGMLIDQIEKQLSPDCLMKDANWCPLNGIWGISTNGSSVYRAFYFKDYLTVLRREESRKKWLKENKENKLVAELLYKEEYPHYQTLEIFMNSDFFKKELQDKIDSEDLVNFILKERNNDVGTKWSYASDFEEFYRKKVNEYNGWYDRNIAMQNYLYFTTSKDYNIYKYLGIELQNKITDFMNKNYKMDEYKNIYIPKDKSVGHVGIKYDASDDYHSLGPFREGGEFYFFNTVVNRTMPCEYWLDAGMISRQYYLKDKKDQKQDTTGGRIWKKEGNNEHFIWVQNTFSETNNVVYLKENDSSGNKKDVKKILRGQAGWGDYYEDDYLTIDWEKCSWHRRKQTGRYKTGENIKYYNNTIARPNAKRLRTDKYFYDSTVYGGGPYQVGYVGNNDKVILKLNNASELHWENAGHESNTVNADGTGGGGEGGWHGWYEFGEVVQCAKDNNFYKRVWKPDQYKIENAYDEVTPPKHWYDNNYDPPFEITGNKSDLSQINVETKQNNNWPHWNRAKRQSFPNPPPWLSNPNYKVEKDLDIKLNTEPNVDKISLSDAEKWAKSAVYQDSNDNKLHLLHWEYCHYYNLLLRYESYYGSYIEPFYVWRYSNVLIDAYQGHTHYYRYGNQYFTNKVHDLQWINKMDESIQTSYGYDPTQPDVFPEYFPFNSWTPYRDKYIPYFNYQSKKVYFYWEYALKDFIEQQERFPTIEQENEIFEQFISNLPKQSISISSGYIYEYGSDDYYGSVPISPEYYKDYYRFYTIKDDSDGYSSYLSIFEISERDITLSDNAIKDREIVFNYIRRYCNNNLIDTIEKIPESIRYSETVLNEYEQIVNLKIKYNYIDNPAGIPPSGVVSMNWTLSSFISEIESKIIKREVKKYYFVNYNYIFDEFSYKENIEYLSYISFNEFCHIWQPLSDNQKNSLNLQGDMPQRNSVPYPPVKITGQDLISVINYLSKNDQQQVLQDIRINAKNKDDVETNNKSENEIALLKLIKSEVLDIFNTLWNVNEKGKPYVDEEGNSYDEENAFEAGEKEYKCLLSIRAILNALNDTPFLSMCMPFTPKIDQQIINENERRAGAKPKALPPFKLSHLDESNKLTYMRQPVDPYSNGKVNPINEWKKYFNKRQIYTIPEGTVVKGNATVSNALSINSSSSSSSVEQSQQKNKIPNGNVPMHPRAISYSYEDGARRLYPHDKYISPIIEYQKIIRLNWQRLPQYNSEEVKYKFQDDSTFRSEIPRFSESYQFPDNYQQLPLWKSDIGCNWGDGFNVQVNIPFSLNNEIQSPFSQSNNITLPIGKYAHNCVKPENQMRYHIEFYDSLEKIRLYDFPNYVRIMHEFQKRNMPKGIDQDQFIEDPWSYYDQSYYKENFNDYEQTLGIREEAYVDDELINSSTNVGENKITWNDELKKYWEEIKSKYENVPIVRDYDSLGNETVENEFVEVDGKQMWVEQQRNLLPSYDKVAFVEGNDGTKIPGYYNSKGDIIKGGNVVEFNNPTGVEDGKWVQQCLGAIVKAKCLQIMEDRMGYRYQIWTKETALTLDQPLRGSDYIE